MLPDHNDDDDDGDVDRENETEYNHDVQQNHEGVDDDDHAKMR